MWGRTDGRLTRPSSEMDGIGITDTHLRDQTNAWRLCSSLHDGAGHRGKSGVGYASHKAADKASKRGAHSMFCHH